MANVQGKFYRGETQRSGVTPTSPPNAVDEPVGPLNPPGSGSTTTYKQLGDTTDKSFIGKNGFVPVVVNENALTLQPNIPNTGVAVFGGVTFNSTTTVDIGIVKGYIVNNETDPLVSSVQYIEYAGATGVTVTTVGSGTRSYGLLKSDGTIHFQNTFPTSEDRKEMIYLFKVGHPSGSITVVANEPDFVLSPLQQFRDLFQAFNYVNEGVYPYPDAADLTFNTSAGIIVGNGINFVADTLNPNTLPVSASVPCTFVYRTQTGAGGIPVTNIEPNNYDNAGTITTIGGGANRSTLQYIHYSPNLGFVIQYGQTIYDNLVDAIASIGKETHVVYENLIRDALLIGVLALKRTTTDLTNEDDARFYRADIFGQLVGSAAGTSVTTLQRAYLNSLIPQIETVSGELTIKNGGALDTDVVFAIRDLLDVDNIQMYGNGRIRHSDAVNPDESVTLGQLADIATSGSPYDLAQEGASDGDVLTWVAANSRYEPVAPTGGGSLWTDATTFIYRDGPVVVGQTTRPTQATFAVRSQASTTGALFFRLINVAGNDILTFNDAGQIMIVGNPTTRVTEGHQFHSNGTAAGNLFTITNGSNVNQFSLTGNGVLSLLHTVHYIGNPVSPIANGITYKCQGSGGATKILRIDNSSNVEIFSMLNGGTFNMGAAANFVFGTTTGTKLGTATTQKLAFWNKTPIIQPTTGITAAAFVANTSGIANDTATYGGYTMGQIAAALINTGILA